MCGRYYIDIDNEELKKILSHLKYISDDLDFRFITGEVFPTNIVPIITSDGVILGRWGFPRWNKKGTVINAKVENLRDRMMFRDIVDTKRCVVPATAYYEWKKTSDGSEEKGRYTIEKEDSILYMAGLYDYFSDTVEQLSLLEDSVDTEYLAFTIITKEASGLLSNIHHRMPLILNENEVENWLKGEDISNVKSKDEKDIFYSSYRNFKDI